MIDRYVGAARYVEPITTLARARYEEQAATRSSSVRGLEAQQY